MAVEFAFAQPREMFAAAQNLRIAQSGKKLARVQNRVSRICRHGSRTHHATQSLGCQGQGRSEGDIEPQSAAVFADALSMFAEELSVAGIENSRSRRCGAKHVAKA